MTESVVNLDAALAFVRQHVQQVPEFGLILGSGLSELADVLDNPVILESGIIPGYPSSTVLGHKGRLVFGELHGRSVVFVQGRLHVYEGHSVHTATFPVRLLGALGVNKLIVTNAAGGISERCVPGTLMWITDHINFSFKNPLRTLEKGSPEAMSRMRSHASPYDLAWTERAKSTAADLNISTEEGTYLWTLGPSYETRAEIRMFEGLGADAVGMSTVPEVIEASALGMSVLGLSTITNFAAGLSADSLNHDEVLEVGRQVRADLQRLVRELIRLG